METNTLIENIKSIIKLLKKNIDLDFSVKRIYELDNLISDESFWENNKNAKKILKEKSDLEEKVSMIKKLEKNLIDNLEIQDLAKEENEIEMLNESEIELKKLFILARNKQLETLLSGEVDDKNCFLEIHPGAGGTEAQDWAEMLKRMYCRWAENKGYKIVLIEESDGEEAGLKSVTLQILGKNAYGWLKTEAGIHRLVRISPFDSSSKRHTSFASVWVYPEIDDTINIEIEEKDLKIDTYRSSGAGGQHVNTTDSAIRITHIPTKIVVQCQTDRSQHRNKATALKMLRARLYELELQKREEETNKIENNKSDIGWGHQIRSYVLHPYQMVKDLRTDFESSNTQSVLDGNLDQFIESSLAARVGMKR